MRFRFTSNLLHGACFMNAGCSGDINGENILLHRIVDAAMFKVEPIVGLRAEGEYMRFAVEPACLLNGMIFSF